MLRKQPVGSAQTKPTTLRLFKALATEAYEDLKKDILVKSNHPRDWIIDKCTETARSQFIKLTNRKPHPWFYNRMKKSLRDKINRESRKKTQAQASCRSHKKRREPPMALNMKNQGVLWARDPQDDRYIPEIDELPRIFEEIRKAIEEA